MRSRNRSSRPYIYGVVLIGLMSILVLTTDHAAAATSIEQVLDITPFEQKDWDTIKNGGTARTTIASASTREIAVGVACLVDKSRKDPLAPLRDLKPLLPDEFVSAFGMLPNAASAEVFSDLRLGSAELDEAHKYQEFTGGFGLNLAPQEIKRFHASQKPTIDTLPQFYQLLHRQLFDRLFAYRQGGLAGMQLYDRGNRDATLPADELKRTMATATPLKSFFPELHHIWTRYPSEGIGDGREHYLWSIVDLNDRPAIILSQRIDLDLGERQIIAERFFYSSRFINTGYALSAVVPVEEGCLFFYIYRVWIDRWRGMARLKQSAGQRLMIEKMEAHLEKLSVCRLQ